MAKKVYVDAGHGGYDNGAVKYVTEDKVNLVMALACRDYLKANGVSVKMSRTTDVGTSISKMAKAANEWGADLVVSLHNNAGGGDGFEVYCSVSGGTGRTLAKNIEAEVKKIGQNSRGVKTKKNSSGSDYFGMIRLTDAPAVICEGAFVDNKKDAKAIDTKAEQQAFGYAYARGILKTLGIKDKGLDGGKSEPAKSSSSSSKSNSTAAKKSDEYLVKVTATALNIRDGAGTKYKAVGVIRDKGTYTIVETKGNFGKLKSGKGWICLDYTKKVK